MAAVAPVVDLANKYADQFKATVAILQDRSAKLGDEAQAKVRELQAQAEELRVSLEPQVQRAKEEFKAQVEDVSPIQDGVGASEFLLQTQLWTAVCLVGMSVGHLLGRYFLGLALGLVLDTSVSLILSFVVLPLWFYYYNRKVSSSDDDKRMILFGVSLLIGILAGYNLSERHLHFLAPPAFLLPAVIGLTAAVLGPKFAGDRKLFLGATVGSAAALYLVLGVLSGSMGVSYLLWVIVSCGAAAVQLQLVLGQLRDSTADMVQTQLFAVLSAVLIQSALFYLLGNPPEKAAEIEAAQAADQK